MYNLKSIIITIVYLSLLLFINGCTTTTINFPDSKTTDANKIVREPDARNKSHFKTKVEPLDDGRVKSYVCYSYQGSENLDEALKMTEKLKKTAVKNAIEYQKTEITSFFKTYDNCIKVNNFERCIENSEAFLSTVAKGFLQNAAQSSIADPRKKEICVTVVGNVMESIRTTLAKIGTNFELQNQVKESNNGSQSHSNDNEQVSNQPYNNGSLPHINKHDQTPRSKAEKENTDIPVTENNAPTQTKNTQIRDESNKKRKPKPHPDTKLEVNKEIEENPQRVREIRNNLQKQFHNAQSQIHLLSVSKQSLVNSREAVQERIKWWQKSSSPDAQLRIRHLQEQLNKLQAKINSSENQLQTWKRNSKTLNEKIRFFDSK
jgi:hypothetical protein